MRPSVSILGLVVTAAVAAEATRGPNVTPNSPEPGVASAAGAADVVYIAPPTSSQLSLENRLMVVPATGGTPRELFSPRCLGIAEHCEYADPSWSPDGQRLAFAFRGVSPDGTGEWQIRIARADGKVHWVVTEHAGANTKPTWSPDKRSLAYQHRTLANGRYRFWISHANLCGRLPVRAPQHITEGMHPSYSQSGDWIAYSFNGDIYKTRPDGSQRTRLTSDPGTDVEPAWTKPGTTQAADQIAFASNRSGSAGYDIYMMKSDGSNVRRITHLAGDERWPDLPESPFFVTHESVVGTSRSIRTSTTTSSKSIVAVGRTPALGTSGKVSGGCPPV